MSTCSICYETIENGEKPWTCNHEFHTNCISKWKGSCPNCRNSALKNKNGNFVLGECYGLQITIKNYSSKWNNQRCLDNNHKIILSKPFGVLGICQNCNHTQGFNWMK